MLDSDVKENALMRINKKILPALLQDKTTGHNLLWATDGYEKYGAGYKRNEEITVNCITGINGEIIRPRVVKSKKEQEFRIRDRAEVFTPTWICNKQNNLIDTAWFGYKAPFNCENHQTWITNYKKIGFKHVHGHTWQDYVSEIRLEIACGEAPYITSRYDTVTGSIIPVKRRIGILDRKLRIISENTNTSNTWLKWTEKALKSVYAFDWQGDNVLLARENALQAVIEAYNAIFKKNLSIYRLQNFSEILSWNIWQMDGMRFVIPDSCKEEESLPDLLGRITKSPCPGCRNNDVEQHNGIYCIIMDWEQGITQRFVDIVKGGGHNAC